MKGNPFAGWHYVWRGFSMLNQPGLRMFVVIPLLLNVVVMSAATWWGGQQISLWIEQLTNWLPGWLSWLYWLLMPVAILTLLFVLAYFFSTILVVIASPFNGLLSERVEAMNGSLIPDESMMSTVKRTFGRELTKLMYLLPRYIGLLVLSFIPVVNLASPVLWFWFGSWVVALQYVDYSYDNHRVAFTDTRRQVGQQSFTALGFGGLVAFLMMIPVVNWFVMPAAVIGSTLMRLERYPFAGTGKDAGSDYAEISTDPNRLMHGSSERSGGG